MVRFSCFPAHIHYHKSKKAIQQSSSDKFSEEMQKNSLEFSQDVVKVSPGSASSILKEENNLSNNAIEQITSPASLEYCWKSEDLNSNSYPDDEKEILQTMYLKKSQSLGSGLDRERGFSCDVDMEDEIDQGLYSHDKNHGSCFASLDNYDSAELCGNNCPRMNLLSQNQENVGVESYDINPEPMQNESLFSIGDPKQFDKEPHEDISEEQSTEHVINSGPVRSETPAGFVKSQSLPSLRVCTAIPRECSPTHEFMGPQSRTFEDLCVANARTEDLNGRFHSGVFFHQVIATSCCHDMSQTSNLVENRLLCRVDSVEECALSNLSGGSKEMVDQEKDFITGGEEHKYEHQMSDRYYSHAFSISANDWKEPEVDGVSTRNNYQEESLVQKWDGLTCKEFSIKRIEEWVRQIDIQDSFPVQELGESSNSVPKVKKESRVMSGVTTVKPDGRGSPGMEAAYNYISSLTAMSTTAQMANLGLVVIPFLSAFISLRVLNLSGNAIVRITAGALPRGLHMLNLSKNNISTIEGLRELTRLRVLDLSYNRIFRIGHGLASCSSLKELYLAGNKISEVEGLHRLLKLNILELRFNKISTAKCLGQLAANYGSLQAINLEGNPAQRNVGDEQLKRYLLSLLPHLVYYNRHTIRTSSSKEVSDRPARTVSAHQFDRGLRSENKRSRKGKLSAVPHKSTTSSNHGRSGQSVGTSTNQSKGRHGRVPVTGSKGTHQLPGIGSTLLSLQPSNFMRRTRSEGNL